MSGEMSAVYWENLMRQVGLCTLLVVALAMSVSFADWPQFLGPDRNGVSDETGLARSWPKDGPRVLWTRKLGQGFGAAAIQDGKVYVLDREENKRDALLCLDLATGREEWRYAYDAPGKLSHNGSRSTPAVDKKYVFTIGAFGDFHCISKATHKPVWKKHLLRDFGGKRPGWGVSQSPVLYGNLVIVAPLGAQGGVVAYDKSSGKEIWKSKPLGKMEYASPLVTTIDGVDQVVTLSSRGRISAVDAKKGSLLWSYKGWKCNIPIPSPLAIGDGRLFITGGYGAGSSLFKVQRQSDTFAAVELFKIKQPGSIIHNALFYKGHLYVKHNNKKASKGITCLDLKGNVKWTRGKAASYDFGGMVLADGMIFNLDGKEGKLRLIEASPGGYKVLASVQVFAGGQQIWAPLALSDGKLVIRDQKQMKCLDVARR